MTSACVKSSSSLESALPASLGGAAADLDGGGPAADFAAGAGDEATSRTNPSFSSFWSSWRNFAASIFSNFLLTSETRVLPSIWASTARSARGRKLDLPEASSMPLPVLEKIEEPSIVIQEDTKKRCNARCKLRCESNCIWQPGASGASNRGRPVASPARRLDNENIPGFHLGPVGGPQFDHRAVGSFDPVAAGHALAPAGHPVRPYQAVPG